MQDNNLQNYTEPWSYGTRCIDVKLCYELHISLNYQVILDAFYNYLSNSKLESYKYDNEFKWINLESFFELIKYSICCYSFGTFKNNVCQIVKLGYLERVCVASGGSRVTNKCYYRFTSSGKALFKRYEESHITKSYKDEKPEFKLNSKAKEKPVKKLPKKQQMCIDLGFSQELTDKIMAYKGNHNVDTMRRHFSEMTLQEVERVVDLNLNYNQGKQTYGFKYEWNQPNNNYNKSSKISYQEVSSGRCTVIDDGEDW